MPKKARKKTRTSAAKMDATAIPNAELDVLACVWEEAPVTAKRIKQKMHRYRPMAHGSVVTLLTRLETKGLISKVKGPVGKAFLFSSTRKPEMMQKQIVKNTVSRVFGADTAAMATALIEAHPPITSEVAMIQKSLNTAKKRAKKTRR